MEIKKIKLPHRRNFFFLEEIIKHPKEFEKNQEYLREYARNFWTLRDETDDEDRYYRLLKENMYGLDTEMYISISVDPRFSRARIDIGRTAHGVDSWDHNFRYKDGSLIYFGRNLKDEEFNPRIITKKIRSEIRQLVDTADRLNLLIGKPFVFDTSKCSYDLQWIDWVREQGSVYYLEDLEI